MPIERNDLVRPLCLLRERLRHYLLLDANCVSSTFCSGTTCTTDLDPGGACVRAAQCKSGFCIDGVCCDRACIGACEACSATKKGSGVDGACGFVVDGSDPDTECTPQSCAASVVTKPRLCDGAGVCRADGTISCEFFPCAGAACATSCALDTDCLASGFCSATTCTSDLDLGGACGRAAQCKSGFCTDGVCCDKACGGGCEACTAAKKGSGIDGTCADVAADTDPKSACPVGSGVCAADGLCNGVGNCRGFAKAGASCGATTCAAGTVTGKICKGDSATCVDDSKSCGLYACGGTACKSICASDADCVPTAFCGTTGACVAKLVQGGACSAARECVTGSCVDSVCCSGACAGQCKSCNEPGAAGTCLAVSGKPRAPRTACDSLADTDCAQTSCDGTVRDKCAGFANSVTTACGTDACVAGKFEKRGTCDGRGSCARPDPKSCAPYVCDVAATSGCKTTCASDADCDATAFCGSTGACAPKLVQGVACTAAKECATGVCADGVCCNSACTGQCESCSETGTAGTCTAVSGRPRAGRAACDALGDADCAKTSCDGTIRDKCGGFANGTTTPCGADACTTDKKFQRKGSCDGRGTCALSTPQNCVPYVCDLASTTGCKSSCAANPDCSEGYSCSEGACIQGAKCNAERTGSIDETGRETACAPYRCGTDGKCLQACASSDECAAGSVCDVASKVCVTATPASAEESAGCGCETGPRPRTWSLGALLALLAGLGRRRRARSSA